MSNFFFNDVCDINAIARLVEYYNASINAKDELVVMYEFLQNLKLNKNLENNTELKEHIDIICEMLFKTYIDMLYKSKKE